LLGLVLLALTLSACVSSPDTNYKTLISNGKVVDRIKGSEEGETKLYVEFRTTVNRTSRHFTIEVKNKNVWNLIRPNKFYHIEFDVTDGSAGPLKHIDPVEVDQAIFGSRT